MRVLTYVVTFSLITSAPSMRHVPGSAGWMKHMRGSSRSRASAWKSGTKKITQAVKCYGDYWVYIIEKSRMRSPALFVLNILKKKSTFKI
jgi:hypothetical protein